MKTIAQLKKDREKAFKKKVVKKVIQPKKEYKEVPQPKREVKKKEVIDNPDKLVSLCLSREQILFIRNKIKQDVILFERLSNVLEL